MGDKERFMESLGWRTDFTWLDLTGMARLPGERIFKVELVTLGTYEQYEAVKATVLDRFYGVIDSKVFRFNDYLYPADEQPNPNAKFADGFKVIAHCGWDWHLLKPDCGVALTMAIEKWKGFYL